MLPLVLLQVLGGPVIDRFGPRRVSISCDMASVVVVGLFPLLYAADALSFVGFLALVAPPAPCVDPGTPPRARWSRSSSRGPTSLERATGLSANGRAGLRRCSARPSLADWSRWSAQPMRSSLTH